VTKKQLQDLIQRIKKTTNNKVTGTLEKEQRELNKFAAQTRATGGGPAPAPLQCELMKIIQFLSLNSLFFMSVLQGMLKDLMVLASDLTYPTCEGSNHGPAPILLFEEKIITVNLTIIILYDSVLFVDNG